MIPLIIWWAIAGGLGGLARTLVSGKGIILLPGVKNSPEGRRLDLGFIAPMAIGMLAGYLAPSVLGTDGIVAAMAGYSGADAIENFMERFLKKDKPPA